MQYDKAIQYLKKYSTEELPYDPNGAIHLLKATIENLQKHFTQDDLVQYAACLDKENEKFLNSLLMSIPVSRKNENNS